MLQVSNLTVSFGGLRALENVSMRVEPGEVIGLIGPNGSGKTTLLNTLSGVYSPDSGSILLDGRELAGLPAFEINGLGVARTFQNLRLFKRMTVLQNVMAAVRTGDVSRAHGLLDLVGLAGHAKALAGELGLPMQRRLELARALMGHPKVLLLDEPTGGMTPGETGAMANVIREQLKGEQSIIIVEHKIALLRRLCGRFVALNFGQCIADGSPAAVLNEPAVREAYLGPDDDTLAASDR
ncbi:MAG: ATP-binding cassette domain-containing protein [Gammaproteobacteria bacterium]|nr:ATP-binding cassette domain-containing protein [Gammaproteobacteria bacterium]